MIKHAEQVGQKVGVSQHDPSSERKWKIWGSTDRDAIMAYASTIVPPLDTCGGVARFFDSYTLDEETTGVWVLQSKWRKNPSSWELSIDTSGGTGKIFQSINTVKGYSCLGLVPAEDPTIWQLNGAITDYKKAIGVNGNNVEGVDIVIPKFDFTINYKMDMATLASSYLMTLYDLTGKVNDRIFTLSWDGQNLSFHPGDLRFMGAPCKKTSNGGLDISFRFSASKAIEIYTANKGWFTGDPFVVGDVVDHFAADGVTTIQFRCLQDHTSNAGNRPPNPDYWEVANLRIGDSIAISKRGWEYLWVQYAERTDAQTNSVRKVPIAVYVEQVCKYGNFQLLGI